MILNKLVVTLILLLFHPHTSKAQWQYLDANHLEENSVFAYNFTYDYNAGTGELSPSFDPGKTDHTPYATRSISLTRFDSGSEHILIRGHHPVSASSLSTSIDSNLSSISDKLSIRYVSHGRPTLDPCVDIQAGSLYTHPPYQIEDLIGNSAALNSFGCTNTSIAFSAPKSDFLQLIFHSSIQSSVLANLTVVGPQAQSDDSRKLHLQKIHKCLLGWKHGIYNRVTLSIHPVIDNNNPTLSGANQLDCD